MAEKNGTLRPLTILSLEGGRKINMRPTMEALEAIERRLYPDGVMEVYKRIRAEKPRFTDLAACIYEGALACGEKLDYKEAFGLVQAEFLPCSVACFNFIATAFGPVDPEQKPGPPPAV